MEDYVILIFLILTNIISTSIIVEKFNQAKDSFSKLKAAFVIGILLVLLILMIIELVLTTQPTIAVIN